jgi:hypothetical protein
MMRAALIAIAGALALGGCGSGGGETTTTTPTTGAAAITRPSPTTSLPPEAVAPAETHEEDGAAAIEASPGSPASGPKSSGELPEGDRAAIASVVGAYIGALDRHDAAGVCELLEPGALTRAGLAGSRNCTRWLAASIGRAPRGGGPAWRRTALVETNVERLSDERARVSATVTHRFSDRKYVSVEDDVVYLQRVGGRWLLAKPSATLYRAVGYESPPLAAFRPPPGW